MNNELERFSLLSNSKKELLISDLSNYSSKVQTLFLQKMSPAERNNLATAVAKESSAKSKLLLDNLQ